MKLNSILLTALLALFVTVTVSAVSEPNSVLSTNSMLGQSLVNSNLPNSVEEVNQIDNVNKSSIVDSQNSLDVFKKPIYVQDFYYCKIEYFKGGMVRVTIKEGSLFTQETMNTISWNKKYKTACLWLENGIERITASNFYNISKIILPASIVDSSNIPENIECSLEEPENKKINDCFCVENYRNDITRVTAYQQGKFTDKMFKQANLQDKRNIIFNSGITELDPLSDSCKDNIVRVVLPEGLTEIPANMFSGCKNLEKVILPRSTTKICHHAFANCPKLKSIQFLGNNLKVIEESAFSGCINLQDIKLPSRLEVIGSSAFSDCKALCWVKTSADIGNSAFKNCTGITYIICEGTKNIGKNAFFGCKSLLYLKIPGSVKRIEEGAFSNCVSIKTIYFEGTENIEKNAFLGCKALSKLELPINLVTLGKGAFFDCPSIETVVFPTSIKHVYKDAFMKSAKPYFAENKVEFSWGYVINCENSTKIVDLNVDLFQTPTITENMVKEIGYNFKHIILKDNIIKIGDNAFRGCPSLISIELSRNLTHIGKMAFADCPKLAYINIPKSVNCIDDKTFISYINLKEVIINHKANAGQFVFGKSRSLKPIKKNN